jgi:hypothetical protein
MRRCEVLIARTAFTNTVWFQITSHHCVTVMPKPVSKLITGLVLIGMTFEASHAAESGPLADSWILDVGGFFLSTDTRVRVNGEMSGTTGSDIDFEDTFGIGDNDRLRIDARWRFGQRHAIRGMYFDNNRSASRNIERDIQFGDQRFPVGVNVSASSELTVVQLSYDYAFVQTPQYEIAAGLGLHMLDAALSLSAELTSSGGTMSSQVDERAATQAPLPVVGLRGLWRLSENVYVTAAAQYFYVDLDAYTGSLTDLSASLVWDITRRVGIGVGYDDFQMQFDVEDAGNFNGRLRWSYGGALAFLSLKF